MISTNFHLPETLQIFEKKSADKIWSNKDKGIKISCPVPEKWMIDDYQISRLKYLKMEILLNNLPTLQYPIVVDLQHLKRWFCIFYFAGTVVDSGVFAPVLTFQKLFEDEGVPITSDEVRAPMGVHKRVCN